MTKAEAKKLAEWMFATEDEDEVQYRVSSARAEHNLNPEEMRMMELAILDATMERHRTLGAWAVGTQFFVTCRELKCLKIRKKS